MIMRTRRRTYAAATPSSLFPKFLRAKHIIQSNRITKKTKKCSRAWDLYIPTELLEEILSRVGLKANINASLVCKTWFEAAVSVRKPQPHPWLFSRLRKTEDYYLFDTLQSKTYKQKIPDYKRENHYIYYSRDGWLLVNAWIPWAQFLLNPFTQECIYLPEKTGGCFSAQDYMYLPKKSRGYVSAFSAAPTSTSCFVISLVHQPSLCLQNSFEIHTWRPGATVWTTHCFLNCYSYRWEMCVFSNGMFYFLTKDAYLAVFDPTRGTWDILSNILPFPTFSRLSRTRPLLLMEHEGDIFVIHIHRKDTYPLVFKLNLEREVWEKKRDLGGLTVFASNSGSLIRAGLSAEERNRIYYYHSRDNCIYYYSQGDDKSSHPPSIPYLSNRVAWVDPPMLFARIETLETQIGSILNFKS